MNAYKLILLLFLGGLVSCSTDDSGEEPLNELENLNLITELSNGTHTFELYSETGILFTGYNKISLRIKHEETGEYLTNAELDWKPSMHMSSMEHAAPATEIVKVQGEEYLFKGAVVFTMPGNSEEYWELTINYRLDGTKNTVTGIIDVSASKQQNVVSFKGSDDKSYTLALVQPSSPEVAINDIVIGLWEMKSMMEYEIVDHYNIRIDPRMPGMGNHSSPNNVNLVQGEDAFYHGKLSLTMTGLWRINMQVVNSSGEVIKGEPVTDTNPESSLYQELEF